MAYSTVTKGVNTYQKKERKKVGVSSEIKVDVPTTLNKALAEQRVPTTLELLNEAKSIMGVTLIHVRSMCGEDPFKTATAIHNIVKALSQVVQLEKVDEVSELAIANMSNIDLAEYASKLIDKLAN